MLLITDIPNKSSELLFSGSNTEIVARAFNAAPAKNSIFLPGIVSRKKQVIPAISAAIEKLDDR
jgi:manganese-dependent inorganic pyrophosphatase